MAIAWISLPPNGIGEPASAHAHDALLAAKQSLRRRGAKTDQNFGVDERDLAAGEGQTGRRFKRRRGAVSRRPPRHHIGDINVSAVEPDRSQHLVEQLAACCSAWNALIAQSEVIASIGTKDWAQVEI